MHPVIAILGAGAMGSAVGHRLAERGATVITYLEGRSPATVQRARDAGMTPVSLEQFATAHFVLSIVPPAVAMTVAEQVVPVLHAAATKPVYVDCNAISPTTAQSIAAVIAPTGSPFVDAGIIGYAPRPGYSPVFYASGTDASRFAALNDYGITIRVLQAAIGAASGLKMSYAGISKGFSALSSAMILAATRAGADEALYQELSESQPALLAWLTRQLPGMPPKAYRWVKEMQEIAEFAGEDPAARQIYLGVASLYERLAKDFAGEQQEIAALREFVGRSSSQV